MAKTIEKGNEQTHNFLGELIEDMKQQSKVNLEINDKTINAIATNSKEARQFITKTLRKEKKPFQTMKNTKFKQKTKNLTLKNSGKITSVQESKYSGNIIKPKEPMKRFSNL